ncbi:hypothetical protein D6D06_08310 [Aureobasidium pullulans]|nr:hypothetical protein D6D06_08310 [Aureobasidium pullulans]
MDAVIADINTLFVRLTRFYEKLATFTGPDQDVFPQTPHDAQTRQATDQGEYTSLRSALFECKAVFNKFIAEGPELDAQADADHAELDELRTLKRKFESKETTQETLVQVVRSAAKTATKLETVETLKQERDDAQAEVTRLRQARGLYNDRGLEINRLCTERQNESVELTQLRQARALYDDRAAEIGRFRADAAQVQTNRAELARLRLHNTNA